MSDINVKMGPSVTHPNTVGPTITPAMISPTTTGKRLNRERKIGTKNASNNTTNSIKKRLESSGGVIKKCIICSPVSFYRGYRI